MMIRMLRILTLVVLLPSAALAQGGYEGGADEELLRAEGCFETRGGPQGCPTIFGWCPATKSADWRLGCRERLHMMWSRVLDNELTRLTEVAAKTNVRDGADGTTPVVARIAAEQEAWEIWRDARCDWDMPRPEGNVTSPDEARFICREHMTRERAQQIWDMAWYLATTPLE